MAIKISNLLAYLLYACIGYNVLYPNTEYITYIENYYTLYCVIGTLGALIILALMAFLAFAEVKVSGENISNISQNEKIKTLRGIDKMHNEIRKNKWKILLGRTLSLVAGLAAFIILSQHYVGSLLLFGCVATVILFSQIKSLAKKVENKLSESA